MIVEHQPRPVVYIPLTEVERICHQALSRFVSPAAAVDELVAQLLDAELRGKHSHGVVRIPWLKGRLGRFHHQPVRTSQPLPWLLQIDCRQSLGYLAAREGQRQLLRMLTEQPFAVVVCSEAFPTGVLGDYLRPLADSGFVAVGFATSPPLVSLQPDGEPMLGTNPLCVAMPGRAQRPAFVADLSPAPTTFGQLLAMLSGFAGDLEDTALLTSGGRPPREVSELFDEQGRFSGKILQPLDSTKQRRQYALTLAIELLTKLFTGETANGGMVLLACDPQRLPGMHPEAVVSVIERIADHLDWQSIPGGHGEARRDTLLHRESLPLPQTLWQSLQILADEDSAADTAAG